MAAYPEVYLDEVVENQGKLFDYVAHSFPDSDTVDFINAYMSSKTRKHIDDGQAYVNTMDAGQLWDYFSKNEPYSLKPGKAMDGFMPDWIGEFSSEVIKKIPVTFLMKAYYGLHDLELDLAVKKVGKQ